MLTEDLSINILSLIQLSGFFFFLMIVSIESSKTNVGSTKTGHFVVDVMFKS